MKQWYVIIVYGGKETLAKLEIADRRKVLGMEDVIGQIFVPTITVDRIQYGKKVKKNEKLYGGYIFAKLDLTKRVIDVLRSTPNIYDIVKAFDKYAPIPEEHLTRTLKVVKNAGNELERLAKLSIGEQVKVIDGLFDGQVGKVEGVTKKLVRVVILMFDRPTVIEVLPRQIESLEEKVWKSEVE